jgi:hypothetical protein
MTKAHLRPSEVRLVKPGEYVSGGFVTVVRAASCMLHKCRLLSSGFGLLPVCLYVKVE